MKQHLLKFAGMGSLFGLAFAAAVATDLQANDAEVVTESTASLPESFSCADPLAQDENTVLAAAYASDSADCMFVGCGGVF